MTALAAVAPTTTHDELEQLGPDDLVTVFLGKEQFAPPDFKDHPQVQYLTADNGSLDFRHLRDQVSPSCKVLITTDNIPQALFHQLVGFAKGTNRPYVHRKHPNAIAVQLAKYFPNAKTKATKLLDSNGDHVPERGRIQALLDRHPPDLSKSSTDEARRLFAIAQQEGTPTTINSLATAISNRKRKEQRGDIPASARGGRRNKALEIKTELEDMQIRLGLMAEWVTDTEAENVRLRAKMDEMHRVLGVAAG